MFIVPNICHSLFVYFLPDNMIFFPIEEQLMTSWATLSSVAHNNILGSPYDKITSIRLKPTLSVFNKTTFISGCSQQDLVVMFHQQTKN